jgi:hypothetical protein
MINFSRCNSHGGGGWHGGLQGRGGGISSGLREFDEDNFLLQ